MNNFIKWLEKNIIPPLTKFTNTKVISAFVGGFQHAFALILVGAFLQLIVSLANLVPALKHPSLVMLSTLSFGLAGLAVTIGIAYAMGKKLDVDPVASAVLAVAVFFMLNKPELAEGFIKINANRLSVQGLFTCWIAGEVTPWFIYIFTKRSNSQTSDVLPEFVANWFRPLLPGILLLSLAWFITYYLNIDVPSLLNVIAKPIMGILNSYPGFVLFTLIGAISFAVGIHPASVVGIAIPLLMAGLGANAGMAAKGIPPTNIATWTTYLMVVVGGVGATFGLNLLMLFSKSKALKRLGTLTIPTSLFGINEPLIFGIPITFNPTLFIPFVLNSGLINSSLVYLAMKYDFIAKPFDMAGIIMAPPGVAAYLGTHDVKAVILIFVMIAINTFVYYPFFKAYEKQLVEKETSKAK